MDGIGSKNSVILVTRQNLIVVASASRGRVLALAVNKKRRREYLESVARRVCHLAATIRTGRDVAKIAVAMLYLGEGAKNRRGPLLFGNSNPGIMQLFLNLLRHSYAIDERKFRCTVQCRADQNVNQLEQFWPQITKIPFAQFYKTRIDPRTIGKPSKKLDYKGVCRIEYFSADLYQEIIAIGNLICKTGL